MTKSGNIGPVSYFRCKEKKTGKNFLDLNFWDSETWGWAWGDDEQNELPLICIRTKNFTILSLKKFKSGGFCLYVLGFWWMR